MNTTKERIKKLAECGITIKAIANISKIAPATLYGYTSNKSNISIDKEEKLIAALDILERIYNENDT